LSVDPTTLALGVAGGAAVGIAVSYFVFFNRAGKTKVQVVQRDSSGQMRKKTVTTDELDASKREMRTLMLERDLLQSALTKIYEAESDGQITREEREMIARRYSSQIREFEAKLRDKELVVEVGELEGLRDELVSLFREKIQNIESRLDQARERLQPMRQELRPEPPPRQGGGRASPAIATTAATGGAAAAAGTGGGATASSAMSQADDLERAVERKAPARRDESDGEKRVKALRDEVMDALAKLEQIDTRKEADQA
jgi:MFS superfamily sulfate permease-like transporter